MTAQVLRYTLYGKERSTFVDASSLHNDWWQKIRNLWNPPKEAVHGEERKEDAKEEGEECAAGGRSTDLTTSCQCSAVSQ